MDRRTLGLRLLPFLLGALLPFPLALLPPRESDPTPMVAGAALTAAIAVLTVALPWGRLPQWAPLLPALVYCVVVGLVRDAEGGGASGYSLLLMLPVIWMALYGSRRHLWVVLAATDVTLVAPILLIGPPGYPLGEWRRALVWVFIAPVVGSVVQRLVQSIRRHEQDLTTVADVVRRVMLADDPRAGISEAIRDVAEADLVLLLEPDHAGFLCSTARAGMDFPPVRLPVGAEQSQTVAAYLSGEPLFTPDLSTRTAQPVLQAAGAASSLHQPVLRGDDVVGVLAIAWRTPRRSLRTRTIEVLRLLADEAAAAIERAELTARLRRLARDDPLTGLPNRRTWDELLKREAMRARRTLQPLVVGLIDLDHFKAYNDTFGHQAGDLLLKEAAAAWRSQLREVDVLARWGGEEFGVLLPDCSLEEGQRVISRLLTVTPHHQTASAGLTGWTPEDSEDTLTARADQALYAAKAGGRNQAAAA